MNKSRTQITEDHGQREETEVQREVVGVLLMMMVMMMMMIIMIVRGEAHELLVDIIFMIITLLYHDTQSSNSVIFAPSGTCILN